MRYGSEFWWDFVFYVLIGLTAMAVSACVVVLVLEAVGL